MTTFEHRQLSQHVMRDSSIKNKVLFKTRLKSFNSQNFLFCDRDSLSAAKRRLKQDLAAAVSLSKYRNIDGCAGE